jgi:predicted nucleic acid-binding protein
VWTYVDSTVLIALGSLDELQLLDLVPGEPAVLPAIREEVDDEPEATRVEQSSDRCGAAVPMPADGDAERARSVLDDPAVTGDVGIVAAVLATAPDEDVLVLTDDSRLRNIVTGLRAEVSGTLGVLVDTTEAVFPVDEAKRPVERVDETGRHTTGELRDGTRDPIDEAAED